MQNNVKILNIKTPGITTVIVLKRGWFNNLVISDHDIYCLCRAICPNISIFTVRRVRFPLQRHLLEHFIMQYQRRYDDVSQLYARLEHSTFYLVFALDNNPIRSLEFLNVQ